MESKGYDELQEVLDNLDGRLDYVVARIKKIDNPPDYHNPDYDEAEARMNTLIAVKSDLIAILQKRKLRGPEMRLTPVIIQKGPLIPIKTLPHWVSFMIQENETSKPWVCNIQESCIDLPAALSVVKKMRKQYRVLSAWIDVFDGGTKVSVMHECYIDYLGQFEKKEER